MWRWRLLEGWAPDRRTVGLLLFGFSTVIASAGLVPANQELGVLLNIPPSDDLLSLVPFAYPLAQRVQAGSAFVGASAAAFAAAGGLALFGGMRWGGPLAAASLGIEAAAIVLNTIAGPHGVFVIGQALAVVWNVALILVVTGFRPFAASFSDVGEPRARSWMDEAFAADHDEGTT